MPMVGHLDEAVSAYVMLCLLSMASSVYRVSSSGVILSPLNAVGMGFLGGMLCKYGKVKCVRACRCHL